MIETVRNLSIRVLCLLLIWATLTIRDVIPDTVKWGTAVKWGESISYVTSGQWKSDRFAESAEEITFRKGCYAKYVNTGEDANIAASDLAEAYYWKKKLYIWDDGIFYAVRPTKKPADTLLYEDVTLSSSVSAFIMSSKSILGVDDSGEELSVFRISDQLEHTFSRDSGEGLLENMDFAEISNLAYTILSKQETGEISVDEMAVLMYCTQKGILLGWTDETAWFADDRTDPELVAIYTMSADKSLTKKLEYENTYAGTGAGRFIANDALFYADAEMLYIYYLDGSESFYVPSEVYGSPAEAMNYTYNSETETYWIGYINGDTIYCLDYVGDHLEKGTLSYVQSGEAVTGLFAADGYFYVTYDDGETHFSYHQP